MSQEEEIRSTTLIVGKGVVVFENLVVVEDFFFKRPLSLTHITRRVERCSRRLDGENVDTNRGAQRLPRII